MALDQENAKTRLLLILWGLGGLEKAVLKGKIHVVRTREKVAEYDDVFDVLEKTDKAIELNKKGQTINVTLTQVGYGLLGERLRSGFKFEGNQIGTRMGNYLVDWIAQAHVPNATIADSTPRISSYDEFKVVALETYESLKHDPEHGKLVPVYKIRRKIGDRISHEQFDEWLVEMHRNDALYLHGGGKIDATQDQIIDSIYSDVVKTLYFIAERLTR